MDRPGCGDLPRVGSMGGDKMVNCYGENSNLSLELWPQHIHIPLGFPAPAVELHLELPLHPRGNRGTLAVLHLEVCFVITPLRIDLMTNAIPCFPGFIKALWKYIDLMQLVQC